MKRSSTHLKNTKPTRNSLFNYNINLDLEINKSLMDRT